MAVDEFAMCDWFTAQCQALPSQLHFELGPLIPEWVRGDQAGILTLVTGPGLTNDGLFDTISFQVRVRDKITRRSLLANTMVSLDRVLVREIANQQLWGGYIRLVGRTGGGPAPLLEDQRERITYVCTYFANVEL